jgi:hypothetical protein
MTKSYGLIAGMLVGALCGCSSSGGEASMAGGTDNAKPMGGAYGGGNPRAAAGGSTGSLGPAVIGGGTAALPPEQEQSLTFLAPQPGKRYVYVANPTRDSVAVIDSVSLAIAEVTPGDTPTYVATVSGEDVALVINAGSSTLSVLRTTDAGTTVSSPLPIVKGANAIAIAPGGAHAVVWFDVAQPNAKILSGSFQNVSLVTLSAAGDKAFTVTVGFEPSAVVFSDDGTAAFVVTKDGISELRFASLQTSAIAPLVRIESSAAAASSPDAGTASPDAGAVPDVDAPSLDEGSGAGSSSEDGGSAREAGVVPMLPDAKPATPDTAPAIAGTGLPVDVSVTRDGHWAIARRDGRNELLLVDLVGNSVQSLSLSSPVTDLDISDTTDTAGGDIHAFAVLRDESKLVRIAIPDGFTGAAPLDIWPVTGETVGQVAISAHGKYAVLYTTAVPIERLVVSPLLPSGTFAPKGVVLQKAIRAVAIAPDERTAFVVHTKVTGNPSDPGLTVDEAIDRQYGYSAVSLEGRFATLQTTSANPDPFAITPDSSSVFVLLRDDAANLRMAEQMSLTTFQVKDFQLGSPPNAIGALGGINHKVFVNQVHSEGRISFIDWDWDSGTVESVTGFALNGRIRQ